MRRRRDMGVPIDDVVLIEEGKKAGEPRVITLAGLTSSSDEEPKLEYNPAKVATQSCLVRIIYGDEVGLNRLLPSLYQHHVVISHTHVSPPLCAYVPADILLYFGHRGIDSTSLGQRGRRGIFQQWRGSEIIVKDGGASTETGDEEDGANDGRTGDKQPFVCDLLRAGEASENDVFEDSVRQNVDSPNSNGGVYNKASAN
ncbi:hypothetical protein ACLOJK_037368 [Asimina triloba]